MKKIIVIVIVAILAIFAVVKLKANREKNTTLTTKLDLKEVTVSTKDIIKQNASFTLNFTGTLTPVKELDIPAETSGRITSLKYQLGQHFSKGGVIATIDDKLKQITYDNARIDAEKLENDYKRIENLFKGGTSSQQELDNARFAYETAKNKMEDAAKQLSYTKITTSIPGTISKKNIEEGSFVNAGTVIASIVDISKLKVKINVAENNVYFLKKGDKVKVSADIYPGTEFTGTISFISPDGDDTHNYPVEVEMSNSDKYPLKSGTFVNVKVDIATNRDGLFIPRSALMGSIKDAKIYIALNGKAIIKKIVIGSEKGDMLEVTSGLTGQEKIIVTGQVNLTDNKPIKIINNF
jgi:membrane fusion protein, multidrug efflux system